MNSPVCWSTELRQEEIGEGEWLDLLWRKRLHLTSVYLILWKRVLGKVTNRTMFGSKKALWRESRSWESD